ncbi:uncharacterized protein BDW47DRAFT_112822 [Aspergillus candidus]|uniref:Uncharacterized protein n=1 Tax=Aspergillus candidus TaxID=41067 RepID=A0A2I2F0D9_ASPCN|nr:hypothetical protein BDW47DRAFT_112822 [Aspergillus candidus]PLB34092.1 hypothetical protein BDW47DRAFT_112822 [Aspergillus candidus]
MDGSLSPDSKSPATGNNKRMEDSRFRAENKNNQFPPDRKDIRGNNRDGNSEQPGFEREESVVEDCRGERRDKQVRK